MRSPSYLEKSLLSCMNSSLITADEVFFSYVYIVLRTFTKKGKNRQALKDRDKKSLSSSGCGQQLSLLNEGRRKGKTSN